MYFFLFYVDTPQVQLVQLMIDRLSLTKVNSQSEQYNIIVVTGPG